ncbi:MAG TPA: NAD(P)-binding domain-containing protein [Thermoplasmata archaeon]|nr:NAD(P)-binding domain-containing protein [Thermoplasmata archaeon]
MNVGVLGTGDVAKALARGFVGTGHSVRIGTRDPRSEKARAIAEAVGHGASAVPFAAAAEFGELNVIAVQGHAVGPVVDLAGPKALEGKDLLDTTNPLDFSRGMPPGLFVGTTDSLGEQIQRMVAGARVVKCFNTVPNSQMFRPRVPGGPAEMLICGNDADAKKRTDALVRSFGWAGALDVGGIESARWLEALVPLWVRTGVAVNSFDHVFRVVKP